MIDDKKPKHRGPWLERLAQVVGEGQAWDPLSLRKDFFGEDWILPRVFWEACDGGQVGELLELLDQLQQRPFAQLYPQADLREQGRQLAQGAIQAVRAACRFTQRGDPDLVVEPLRQAAGCFDAAWPAPAGVPALRQAEDPWFAAYAFRRKDSQPVPQTVGFWAAWDLFDRLLSPVRVTAAGRPVAVTALLGRLGTPSRTARLPVLLYDPRSTAGRLALLTVTLVSDNGGVFCPDVLAMGLSVLRQRPVAAANDDDARLDPHNIHDSMQRIWRLSQLAGREYRARWSFTTLTRETIQGWAKPGQRDPLISPSWSGRSAEAAVCCALWSAARWVPGGGPAEQALDLDLGATVSAMLDARDAQQHPRQIRLVPIDGMTGKMDAAKPYLQIVLLAEGQEGVASVAGLEPVRAATVGEAFERLLAMHRHVRNYQDHVDAQWQKQWAQPEPEGTSA